VLGHLKKIADVRPFWWAGLHADDGDPRPATYSHFFLSLDSISIDKRREFSVEDYVWNDVQIAKTADGQYLVAKWNDVDTVKDKVPLGSTHTFYWDYIYSLNNGATWDTIKNAVANIDYVYTTSMYLSYRKIDEDNWSKPVVYRPKSFSIRNTNMPYIVPSIHEIPVITAFTDAMRQVAGNAADSAKLRVLPDKVLSMFLAFQNYNIVYADATKSIDDFWDSIKEGDKSDMFALDNAYPNPVDDNTITFRFSLQKPGQTKLTINNVMGQVVATVVNEYCNASEYTFDNFDVSNLPIGTYYYTLTSNDGKSITKMFNIIR